MIVCHCNAVNDATVLDAIADGARDVATVGAICGAGTNCAGCHESLDRLVAAAAAVEAAFVVAPVAGRRRVREAASR